MFYTTSEIAALFNLHPNTVRLYEKWELISTPNRKKNGYRVFTAEHIRQIEILRLALRAEVIQGGLRKSAIEIIKTVAKREYYEAYELSLFYLKKIDSEIEFTQNAIKITNNLLSDNDKSTETSELSRRQTALKLGITVDTLRNWERNGLIKIKRQKNGYRIYNETDIKYLTIIRELRIANFSLTSILRMINNLQYGKIENVEGILDCPEDGEFIISVCDRLQSSLKNLKQDALTLIDMTYAFYKEYTKS